MSLDELLARFPVHPKRSGSGWVAHCPAHDDRNPSLGIQQAADGRVLLHCRSQNCDVGAIVRALGLTLRDLAPKKTDGRTLRKRETKQFSSLDQAVTDMTPTSVIREERYVYAADFVVVRWDIPGGKRLRPFRRHENGSWSVGAPDNVRPLYRIAEITGSGSIFVVEGERKVDLARELGLEATCSSNGANSAKKTDWSPLAGKNVVILPDADPPGRGYADSVAKLLIDVDPATVIRVVELPGLRLGEDLVDFVLKCRAAGQSDQQVREQIDHLVARASRVEGKKPVAKTVVRNAKTLVLRRFREIEAKPVDWLWPERIPRGKLTLLAAAPGAGKSTIAADIAGRVSTARSWPDGSPGIGQPADVVFVHGEDDPADTTRPRLDAAGADVDRVHLLEIRTDHGHRPFQVATDLELLEQALEMRPATGLVVIDPIGEHLGGIDSHRDNEVRAALGPLAELAARRGVAILVIAHLAKAHAERSAIYSVLGSVGFVGLARCVIFLAKDPDNGDHGLMLPVKSNVSALGDAMRFAIVPAPEGTLGSKVEWLGPVQVGADEVFARLGAASRLPGKPQEAATWLLGQLAEGPVAVVELKDLAQADGLSWRTIQRAKTQIGAVAKKSDLRGGWVWSMPDEERHHDEGDRGEAGGALRVEALDVDPKSTITGPRAEERQVQPSVALFEERQLSGLACLGGHEPLGAESPDHEDGSAARLLEPASDPYAGEERAAILEHEAGMSREQADLRAGLQVARHPAA